MTLGTKVAWLVVVGFAIIMMWFRPGGDQFSTWMSKNPEIRDLEKALRFRGVTSVEALRQLSDDDMRKVTSDEHQLKQLRAAVGILQLEHWLKDRKLSKLYQPLLESGVADLQSLCGASRDKAAALATKLLGPKIEGVFLQSCQLMIDGVKPYSWSVMWWVIIVLGVLLCIFACLAAAYLLLIHIMEQVVGAVIEGIAKALGAFFQAIIVGIINSFVRSARAGSSQRLFQPTSTARFSHSANTRKKPGTEFNLGLYDRIVGRNLDMSRCVVEWNHGDLVEVGKPSVLSVHFHCRNGSVYRLQPSDNLTVNVTHARTSSVIPHVIEPQNITGEEKIRVSFSTRLSGDYSINIKVNGTQLHGNTITRTYLPGPVDASKTVFLQQSNVLVVTAGFYHSMQVAPKDSFGNSALIHQEFLTAEIRKGGAKGELINPECVVDEMVTNRYEILLKVEEPGHYVGCVKYQGNVIGPPSITVISLSEADSSTVDKNVAKKSLNVYYEAHMLVEKGKQRTVYCYPSPKQFQLKEYFMRFIPRRVYTCKVCPSTRIIFDEAEYKFVLDDGYQHPVSLTSAHREVLAATFYKFLLKNIGGSEKFQDKQTFFYTEVKKLRPHTFRGDICLTIDRSCLLNSAIHATKSFTVSEWYKKFNIEFKGEEGLDWGGVSREFFELVCVRCFDPNHGLFMRFKEEDPQALVHPNPKRHSPLKLKHYEFAGRVVGKCLYESAMGNPLRVKARFTRSFLAQIIGLRIHHKYFESDNPELYTTKIQYIRDNDVTDLGLVFAEENFPPDGGEPTIVPLIDLGEKIEVTNHNKMQYLNLLAQYKLAKCVKDEVEHFLKGLNDLIPDHLLSMFDENELELLMCGMGTVSFSDLKQHCVVTGTVRENFKKVVDWFWIVASSYTQEEMAKLLQFVTGCSQLPPAGFKDLNPPFTITASPTHGRLPTAHTCFNQLCLPDYDSYEQFQQAMTLAINEGSEGFGFA